MNDTQNETLHGLDTPQALADDAADTSWDAGEDWA
jgi:hypothetical protein